jgi:SNF2 family DNA or RNA helicase
MLAESQQQYTACETQAVGRIRRYGQTKKVEIWRYIVQDTIDEKIFNERHRDWVADMKVEH